MLFRFLIVLCCIVLFINGCNSLISQHFGTHKLRSFQMDEVLLSGVGDADFIEIEGAWLNDDFVHVPDQFDSKKAGLIIFPVFSKVQIGTLDQNERTKPQIIAWTEDFPYECLAEKNCAKRGEQTLKGIVRKISNDKNRTTELPDDKYQISNEVIYLNVNNAPTAWYWNLLMMLGAFFISWFIQITQFRKRSKNKSDISRKL